MTDYVLEIGAALSLAGYPVHAVVDTFKHPHLNEFIQSTRKRTGMRIIPVAEAPRKVLRVLRQNEILGLLVDRPTPDEGVPVRFFGAIRPGAQGRVTLPHQETPEVIAEVQVADPVFDPASGTFGLRLILRNQDGVTPAGLRCKVSFDISDPGR